LFRYNAPSADRRVLAQSPSFDWGGSDVHFGIQLASVNRAHSAEEGRGREAIDVAMNDRLRRIFLVAP
jgi:hypothetical protein